MRRLIDEQTMMRTIRRISHEIIERNQALEDVVLLGVLHNGVPLAERIRDNIQTIEGVDVPTYALDIRGYRDDIRVTDAPRLDIDLTGKVVILVDDVLYTGRTVRAGMDAIVDLGRPAKIQLAVLVDRGHRELPIRSDYVGKNMPTSSDERIKVVFENEQGIYIDRKKETSK
jgi:pyrimidine operon attenuation protein/uracil phosphoribosyltransferase